MRPLLLARRGALSETSPLPPPPPPTGNPYFITDYSNGLIGAPWNNIFSYTAPGYYTPPLAQSPDGRISIANDPAGSGRKVLRCEIRDSDPYWPVIQPPTATVQKSEIRSLPQQTWNKSGAAYGDIRWFSFEMYLPYNATEKFEWAHTGGNAFIDLRDIHPDNNSWPAVQCSWYPQSSPEWAQLRFGGGEILGSTQYYATYNLFQLTNSSGARIAANHNRWMTIALGLRFHYDFTGWFEAYVDGTLVIPRTYRPTMWMNDFGMYWKGGLYKQANAVFPETGRSVIYYGTDRIGMNQSDVM